MDREMNKWMDVWKLITMMTMMMMIIIVIKTYMNNFREDGRIDHRLDLFSSACNTWTGVREVEKKPNNDKYQHHLYQINSHILSFICTQQRLYQSSSYQQWYWRSSNMLPYEYSSSDFPTSYFSIISTVISTSQ